MEINDTTLGRRDWDTRAGATALQGGWAYGAVAVRHGAKVRRIELRDGDAQGLAQVLCRSLGPLGIAYLPLGVHWIAGQGDDVAALRALRAHLSRDRAHLLVTPSLVRPQRFAPRLAGSRQLAVVDLASSDLRAGLKKKWRNRLVRAERERIEIAERAEIPAWLIEAERRQQRRRRYGNLPPGWFAAWQRLAPGAALTITAGPADAPIAGMSFVLHGRGATYLLGWTSDEGRRISAHNLMMWRAMEGLSSRGIERLDLGQVDPEGSSGLARFKLGTGATLRSVPPVFALGPATLRRERDRPVSACGETLGARR